MTSSPPDEDALKVKEYFIQRGLTFTDEWLNACIIWAKDAYADRGQLNEPFIRETVYEQWLDMDLQEMDSCCLPRDLNQERFKVLTGQFGLQINSIRDIGESAYNQYNKIKKLENENTSVSAGAENTEFKSSWEPKARRCLYLTLTDGTQEIHGMELVQIPHLSLDMSPGVKIVISGPIDCRRGVLHLKPNHVKVLGGQVESLAVENSVEKVLSRALHDPKPPDSGLDPGITRSIRVTHSQDSTSIHNRTTQPIPDSQNQSQSSLTLPISERLMPMPVQPADDFGDDDIFMEIDEEALIMSANITSASAAAPNLNEIPEASNSETVRFAPTVSTTSRKNPTKTKTKKLTAPPSAQSKNNKASGSGNGNGSSSTQSDSSKQKKILSYLKPIPPKLAPSTGAPRPPVPLTNEDVDIGIVELDGEDESSMSDSSMSMSMSTRSRGNVSSTMDVSDVEALTDEKPVPISKSPFQYIRQINSGIFKTGETIRVRGIIATLASNIAVDKSNGEWKLSVNINDGSGYLVARISTQVLQSIIGFSPAQMKQLKSSKSPEGKENVVRGMSNLTSTLVHFNGIIGIRITDQPEQFIFSLTDVTSQDVCALVCRTELGS